MDRRIAAITDLEQRLGYSFKDRALLDRALTHASVGSGSGKVANNEQLEFLGDRVLGLVAAEALIRRRPDWREGDLTRRHAALTAGRACAEVARDLGLQQALRLHGSATKQGGRENDRILGDAMEALIAAIYLESGLAAAQTVFDLAWNDLLSAALVDEDKDSKTALQEWAMARRLALPTYREISRSGPAHAPDFVVEVSIAGHAPAIAGASSMRAAEKAAARAFLAREEPAK
jgi:ribonuclease III